MILEFSKVPEPMVPFYNFYNFNVVPLMGQIISNDRASYEYLVKNLLESHKRLFFLKLNNNIFRLNLLINSIVKKNC